MPITFWAKRFGRNVLGERFWAKVLGETFWAKRFGHFFLEPHFASYVPLLHASLQVSSVFLPPALFRLRLSTCDPIFASMLAIDVRPRHDGGVRPHVMQTRSVPLFASPGLVKLEPFSALGSLKLPW